MKKTLLAAALLAGFATAGVAQAETSVTLYGILDTGYGYNQVKYNAPNGATFKATNSGMASGIFNGNRFGLRGSEDLGNGTRAVFTLEQGFTIGNGEPSSSRAFHRQAWVGIDSDNWGTFTMGRQYNMGAKFVYDLFDVGHSAGDMDNAFGGVGYGNRMDNSFRYVTPDFAGFQGGIAYANSKTSVVRNDTDIGGSDRTNWLSVGLKYANGPIAVGASYDRQTQNANRTVWTPVTLTNGATAYSSTTSPAYNNPDALTSWNIGASYDFEVVKLILAYGQDRHGKMAGGSFNGDSTLSAQNSAKTYSSDFKSNNYYVALSAPVAGGKLTGGWTHSKSNLDDKGDGYKAQDIYNLNYQYPLSKRTSVYVYGAYGTGYAYLDNAKVKEAGVGLNHKF